jgi:predicted GIY-YIG superfamily endonuclease
MAVHNRGKGARYTRSRLPVTLVCSSLTGMAKGDALRMERKVKKLRHDRKEAAIVRGPAWQEAR